MNKIILFNRLTQFIVSDSKGQIIIFTQVLLNGGLYMSVELF